MPTLIIRSTWEQRSNCDPILVTVREYRTLQLDVFEFCPYTRTSIRPGYAGIQGLAPSVMALTIRSTWNQRGNFDPISLTRLNPRYQGSVRRAALRRRPTVVVPLLLGMSRSPLLTLSVGMMTSASSVGPSIVEPFDVAGMYMMKFF
jgi:hypothetical protein